MKATYIAEKATKYDKVISKYLSDYVVPDYLKTHTVKVYNYNDPEEYMIYELDIENVFYVLDVLQYTFENITFIYEIID